MRFYQNGYRRYRWHPNAGNSKKGRQGATQQQNGEEKAFQVTSGQGKGE
jgi:hypothetical protein